MVPLCSKHGHGVRTEEPEPRGVRVWRREMFLLRRHPSEWKDGSELERHLLCRKTASKRWLELKVLLQQQRHGGLRCRVVTSAEDPSWTAVLTGGAAGKHLRD